MNSLTRDRTIIRAPHYTSHLPLPTISTFPSCCHTSCSYHTPHKVYLILALTICKPRAAVTRSSSPVEFSGMVCVPIWQLNAHRPHNYKLSVGQSCRSQLAVPLSHRAGNVAEVHREAVLCQNEKESVHRGYHIKQVHSGSLKLLHISFAFSTNPLLFLSDAYVLK